LGIPVVFTCVVFMSPSVLPPHPCQSSPISFPCGPRGISPSAVPPSFFPFPLLLVFLCLRCVPISEFPTLTLCPENMSGGRFLSLPSLLFPLPLLFSCRRKGTNRPPLFFFLLPLRFWTIYEVDCPFEALSLSFSSFRQRSLCHLFFCGPGALPQSLFVLGRGRLLRDRQ